MKSGSCDLQDVGGALQHQHLGALNVDLHQRRRALVFHQSVKGDPIDRQAGTIKRKLVVCRMKRIDFQPCGTGHRRGGGLQDVGARRQAGAIKR
jgi:hypothetical protein